jgi:cobalt-precorrin 5A hydrolase/precorrin-3B C17-methyltransferase
MKPAIITFAATGAELAQSVAALTGGVVHHCGFHGENAKALLPRLFAEKTPIIGICAAGILIRLLAASLSDKAEEPPVLALSQDGKSVVPLLGGHHGANRLARQLAEALGGHAALTTASDGKFAFGLDEPPAGWVLSSSADAKPAMMALLAGAEIALEGHAPWLAEAGYPISPMGAIRVLVTEQVLEVDRGLVYHPRTLVAGVGCERGVGAAEVLELIDLGLRSQNLSPQSLAAIATIDLKADETALLEAAAHYGVPLRLFTAAELNQERDRLASPSAVVEAEVGTPSVAEAAALKAGNLLVGKRKSARVTCAIGHAPRPLDPLRLGRPPGQLHIVGIGPGGPTSRTAAAVRALDASSDWVGYGLYLDLVADLRSGQVEHRFDLGDEEPRVRHALELAAKGGAVALICSGDAQIYAMAALVYELLEATGERALSDAARRVAVASHPGISAFQAASAAAGALIGHDFCAISLSDLLTPRLDIVRRLEGAARADFVTALYNPRSQRRTDLLDAAKAMFLAHRPGDTPVIIGKSLGRPEERVKLTTLAAFDPAEVDMLSIVLFGASTSKAFTRGDGTTVAYTPRGYERKARAEAAEVVADGE